MTNTANSPEPSATDTGAQTGTTATLPPIPVAAPGPQPVQRRTSGWTIFFGLAAAAMAAILLVVMGLLALGAAVVAGIASGDIEVNTDRVDIDLTPATVAELPASIIEENGEIKVDLTELDVAELQAADQPVELDIRADFGSITVIVPEDLDVSVDAASDLGDVTVFGDSDDGFDNTVIRQNDDADIALDLDLDVGSIDVIRR
ncbi:MAG: LiaF domain-containing protein [Acidimicrobiales bacterium]